MEEDSTEFEDIDNIFLYIYTAECALKIGGNGFILNKGSYLRDAWNILDFIIVLSGWAETVFSTVNLSALRTLRILRPLRSISSIQGLRTIFLSLVGAIPMLFDTVLILLFFFLIFAIAGLQLWMGLLRFRCMNEETGVVGDQDDICGDRSCKSDEICIDSLANPNYGFTNFDNVLYALLIVFQWVTLEGWTQVMIYVQKAFSPLVILYFVPLVFIGAFFLLNLTLAVIKEAFSTQISVQKQRRLLLDQDFNEDSASVSQGTELFQTMLTRFISKPGSKRKTPLKLKVHPMEEDQSVSSNDETPRSGDLGETQRPLVSQHDTDIFGIQDIHNDTKKIYLRGAAKVAPAKNPLHQTIANHFQQRNQIEERRPTHTRQSSDPEPHPGFNSILEDDYYDFSSNLSWNGIYMSTKDKGKEILEETPKFSESEVEVEPEVSPSSSVQDTLEENQEKRFSQWNIRVDEVMAQYQKSKQGGSPSRSSSIASFEGLLQSDMTGIERYTKVKEQVMSIKMSKFHTAKAKLSEISQELNFKMTFNCKLEDSSSMVDVCPYLSQEYIKAQRQKALDEEHALVFSFLYSYEDEDHQEDEKNNLDTEESAQEVQKPAAPALQAEDEKDTENKVSEYNRLCMREKPMRAYKQLTFMAGDYIKERLSIDEKNNCIRGQWSGRDVNPELKQQSELKSWVSNSDFNFWRDGFWGKLAKAQQPVFLFVESKFFGNLMTAFVILNTLVLATDHHGIATEWSDINTELNFAFTIIFAFEMALKLFGMGIIGYCQDPMNYVDGLVVILSLIEIVFLQSGNSVFTAFRTIRIFRTFRVLRVARLFRYLTYMGKIIRIIGDSIDDFAYLSLLLLLFNTIFSLLGMQIFGGKFDFPEGKPRANFDSFHWAFVTVFQVLSMENWQLVQYDGMRSDVGPFSCLFFIAWIFIGNFVLLQAFLAILLDLFCEDEPTVAEIEDEVEDELLARGNVGLGSRNQKEASIRIKQKKEDAAKKQFNLMIANIKDEPDDDKSFSNSNSSDQKEKEASDPEKQHDVIECKRSYFLFSKNNAIRGFCLKISESNSWENVILILIALSSIKLAWDTYILEEDDDSIQVQTSTGLDIFFTWLFTIEFIIKSISMGLIMDKGSYIRESWNKLDLIIVVFSWVELMVTEVDISIIKVFRLLRTLRPLRFISHNVSMKIVVNSLLESIGAILNVVIVVVLVWIMFAILGVSLFGGKFYSCDNGKQYNKSECESLGHDWKNKDLNFDNLYEAMITLFVVSSLESWPDIMLNAVDATEHELAPNVNENPAAAYYFVCFILIGSFFFLNLFIAVVFDQSTRIQKENQKEKGEMSSYLTPEQLRWIAIMKLVPKEAPLRKASENKMSGMRKFIHKIAEADAFEIFIQLCIVGNILQMAIAYEGASDTYTSVLEGFNLAFTCVFIAEAAIRLIGLGPNVYFHDNWYRFDFFVVMASIVEMIIDGFTNSSLSILAVGPQLLRVVRVLRVFRMFRLMKIKQIKSLIDTLIFSLPSVLNVTSLLLLIFFIYAVLGVFLFHDIRDGKIIDNYNNFSNFGMAMILLLRISTGEEWDIIMYDVEDNILGPLFFISFVTIISFVMLNMFILVIIQQYQDHINHIMSPYEIFKEHLRDFRDAWINEKRCKKVYGEYRMSNTYGGHRIRSEEVVQLLKDLGKLEAKVNDGETKLGLPKHLPKVKAAAKVSSWELYQDEEGYVYFHDILYSILKEKYGQFVYVNQKSARTKLFKKLLARREKQIKIAIERKIKKIKKNGNRVYANSRDQFLNEDVRNMNLFSRLMIIRAVLRNWSQYVKKKKEDRLLGRSPSITPLSLSCSNDLYSRDGDDMVLRNQDIVEERRRSSQQMTGRSTIFPIAPRSSMDSKRLSC